MKRSTVLEQDFPASSRAIASRWPSPLTGEEWDRRFPGVLDGVAFMTGGANVIMQLGRPGVGYGVVESRVHSGSVFKNPIKRMRTTFTYLAVAMLGTTEEKLAYRAAVNASHAQVRSTASSPVKYNAFDPGLQLWVAACLFWGVLDTMEKFRGKLTPAQVDELLELTKPLATTLQVKPEMWPKTAAEFETYFESELGRVHIDAHVRGYLRKLVDLEFAHPVVSGTIGPITRYFTIGFLPPKFRDEMEYEWTPLDQKIFEIILGAANTVNRHVPRVIRQAPSLVMMWDFRRRVRKGLPLV